MKDKKRRRIFESTVKIVMKTMNVGKDWAEKRVNALLDSRLMDLFDGPEDPEFQMAADLFMQVAHDEDLPRMIEAIKARRKNFKAGLLK